MAKSNANEYGNDNNRRDNTKPFSETPFASVVKTPKMTSHIFLLNFGHPAAIGRKP
jgi:hypothetical protein